MPLADESQLRERDPHLRSEGLRRRLAEVGAKRFLDVRLAFHEEMPEGVELREAPRQWLRGSRVEIGTKGADRRRRWAA